MKKLSAYIDEYSVSHRNSTNIKIHKVCVPAIMFSVLGIFKACPVPAEWPLWFDWSVIVAFSALVYYSLFKNARVIAAVLVLLVPMLVALEFMRPRFFLLSVVIFVVAWIGQFIGHKIEGKKPSFFDDLFFLLIGPIWTVNTLSEQMGIDLKIKSQ